MQLPQILGSDAYFVPFKDMKHGWTVRGDISQPEVDQGARKAMAEAAQFFQNNLK